jgi:hypothetical protein
MKQLLSFELEGKKYSEVPFEFARTPYPIDEQRSAIAIAYENKNLIADAVMPYVQVPTEEFTYLVHTKAEGFTIPNTNAGRKGRLNSVDFSSAEETAKTVDRGLMSEVPQKDIDQSMEGFDPFDHAAQMIMKLVKLDRESRVASAVFNASNHSNSTTLSGTSQWSHASSTPLTAIEGYLNTPLMRPNIAVFGQETWRYLKAHADIVEAVKGTGANKGFVSTQQFADLFDLEAVYVGGAYYNSNNIGQTASYDRIWGKHAAFIYRDNVTSPREVTWGFTGRWGNPVAYTGQLQPGMFGLRGGSFTVAGESTIEVVSASDLSYYVADAVA